MSLLDRIKPSELGSRLKAARISARLTQESAASALGVARTTVVAIENGDRQVKSAELAKLAEIYGISVNSLLRESAVHFDLVPQFRRSNTARNDEDLALVAARELQRLAAASVELERSLGISPKRLELPEYRIRKQHWADQAEDLAGDLRLRLGIGAAPIVDIFVLAESEIGARVFSRKLPSKIAGLFAFHQEVGACILINSVHPVERRSWTCAHELAHLLTNRDAVDVSWIDHADRSLDERFADRFAGAFLMPAQVARIKFSEILGEQGKFSVKSLYVLARWFNVSMEAMARRLEHLSLLRSGTYESLMERGLSVEAIGKEIGSPGHREREVSLPRLTVLALTACERDLLTEAQVCDLLGMDRVSVRRLLEFLGNEDDLEAPDDQE